MNEREEFEKSRDQTLLDHRYVVQNALTLSWVFGFNKDYVGSVHNLSDDIRKEVFYVAGHIGVIYNYEKHQQILLQGHTNAITSCCVSLDKRWIVTVDCGNENMIAIWDSIKGIPVKIIFNPHEEGTVAVAISPDNLYVATLSKVGDDEPEQTISIWDWTSTDTSPKYTCEIKSNDLQKSIRFDETDSHYLVTNGNKRVIFWSFAEGELQYYSPPVSQKEIRSSIGDFTQSMYIPGTDMAASATTHGDIVLWQHDSSDPNATVIDKRALKVVRVHKSAINVLTSVGRFIVTGGEDGCVRFFDFQLRIEAWYEEFNGGPITSVSFEKIKKEVDKTSRPESGKDSLKSTPKSTARLSSAKEIEKEKNPDFIVATRSALILHVNADAFHNYDEEKLRGDLIVQGQDAFIQCIAAHPSKPYLAISGASGNVQIFDYSQRKVIGLIVLKNLQVTSITFDPKGEYLACGCSNGVVKVLEYGQKIQECQTFKMSKSYIFDIKFSHDSLYFATADTDNCVGIFKWGHRDDDERKPIEWVYVGRIKSHSRPIVGLQFGTVDVEGKPRLMSVGEDRRLIEYDLETSNIAEGVKIKKYWKIGQTAIPTAFLWTTQQNITETFDCEPKYFDSLLFANNEYKFQSFITPDSSRDTMCRKTVLSPTYGGPVNKIMPVYDKEHQSDGKLLAYSTHSKIIGLIKLPMDGNPTATMGVTTQPGEISACTISWDGDYLFSAGEYSMNMWRINKDFIETEIKPDPQAWTNLIEGGESGEFFSEIKEHFYYAQIRGQGEDTSKRRTISGSAPLSQIPDLMRAIDFYASNYEINNLMYELKMMLGGEKAEQRKKERGEELEVSFDTFIKVYVNHRSVFGIKKRDIEDAFRKLGAEPVYGVIGRDHLFNLIKTMGEKMTDEELNSCLSALVGVDNVQLEDRFTGSEFAQNLLGFEDYE